MPNFPKNEHFLPSDTHTNNLSNYVAIDNFPFYWYYLFLLQLEVFLKHEMTPVLFPETAIWQQGLFQALF